MFATSFLHNKGIIFKVFSSLFLMAKLIERLNLILKNTSSTKTCITCKHTQNYFSQFNKKKKKKIMKLFQFSLFLYINIYIHL